MLVFPPYQGTIPCGTVGCVTVARGGSSAILLFLIWTLTLSFPFVVASSD